MMVLQPMTGTAEIDRDLFRLRHGREPCAAEIDAAPWACGAFALPRAKELLVRAQGYLDTHRSGAFECPLFLAREFVAVYQAMNPKRPDDLARQWVARDHRDGTFRCCRDGARGLIALFRRRLKDGR